MHFDRFRLCAPGTRFLTAIDDEPAVEDAQPATTTSDVLGQHMGLIDSRLNVNLPHLHLHPRTLPLSTPGPTATGTPLSSGQILTGAEQCHEYALDVTTTAKEVVKECKNLCNVVVGSYY